MCCSTLPSKENFLLARQSNLGSFHRHIAPSIAQSAFSFSLSRIKLFLVTLFFVLKYLPSNEYIHHVGSITADLSIINQTVIFHKFYILIQSSASTHASERLGQRNAEYSITYGQSK